MPLPTLAPTLTSAGMTTPSYAQILQSLQESFRAIYGADAYIAPDSQDGQMLALVAKAIDDQNQRIVQVYMSFSPTFAQGVELSSLVKMNGLHRLVPTNSTAVGNVVGQSGTVITNGSVRDENGNIWDLPASVTIPIGGSIEVTVTARDAGAVAAATGTINEINTPTRGWQSFVSTADAIAGAPVESDAALRRRQSRSAALPASTPLAALLAAITNITGVIRATVYENDTGAPDTNGLPAHSISAVVEGGDVQDVVDTIGAKKTPGAATFGTTTGTYTDPDTGINYTIDFYVLDTNAIGVEVTVVPLDGWSTAMGDEIKASVAAYINSLEIGEDVLWTRMFPAAYLNGGVGSRSFEITTIEINKDGGAFGVADIDIDFNFAAACDVADITIIT